MAGYLFVHFIGEQKDGEQIYFSISKDGTHWKDLNRGLPILYSKTGEKGVRDPFLLRDPHNKKYYLIATDLRMENRDDWSVARTKGSKDIIVWESEDLIHWSDERACRVGMPDAGCVWAPEAIYDEEKKKFFVFWASFVKEAGEDSGKQRIYASYTRDFISFTPAQKYIEKEKSVIDTTIIQSNGKYHRFTKDEATGKIIQDMGDKIIGGDFYEVKSKLLAQLDGLEGPECYMLPDGKWCLIVDQFAAKKGYLPIIIDDLENGEMRVLDKNAYDFGQTLKRHGGVMNLMSEEYDSLCKAFIVS